MICTPGSWFVTNRNLRVERDRKVGNRKMRGCHKSSYIPVMSIRVAFVSLPTAHVILEGALGKVL